MSKTSNFAIQKKNNVFQVVGGLSGKSLQLGRKCVAGGFEEDLSQA